MKQFDYENSNYKHKEEVHAFVQSFNEMADKYVKSYDNREQDLKRVTNSIEKKTNSIERLDNSLQDLSKKTDELKSLKELSNAEIEKLNRLKGEISYTDSEVQKMELDDLNAQIGSKKSKISKIDAKLDATKAKIKTSEGEKKNFEKELRDLEKERKVEEESLFRTNALLDLINETKDKLNSRVLEIINEPYRAPELNDLTNEKSITEILEEVSEDDSEDDGIILDISEDPFEPTAIEDEESGVGISEAELQEEIASEEHAEVSNEDGTVENTDNSLLADIFKKEGIELSSFAAFDLDKMLNDTETVIKNLNILKRHNIPLNYTLDQAEIYYDISSQDLDDLLSIITTDDEGNGMGFSIDFTFNILKELSKINVDRLIDVYNSEFMNVNSKSGIIHLLKLTNPGLVDFEKNRKANIKLLEELGTKNANAIIEKYQDFINMDNPLFSNLLNTFDRSDLVEKLDADVDVIPKIVEYWKNN
ncbi:MAG TPA: hypothetical protein DCY94_00450 [Firmicutes bacterium]|nr:hypothetical protein [Bacillota bacterium]